jgi:high affinity sulfate transporter 1
MTSEQRQLAHDAYISTHTAAARFAGWSPRPVRGYRARWLREDFVAGLTVAALVLPLGLAFAQLAGLPVIYGLYTSIVPVIGFALVASSPQAVVGAEAALSGIVAAAILPSVVDGHDRIETASALALMIGGICLLGAALRAGRLAQVVSRTVFVGYLAGVAVSVTIGQLPKLLGAPAYHHDALLGQLSELPRVATSTTLTAVMIGIATATGMLLARRFAPRLPAALLLLVASAVIVRAFGIDERDVALIGELPSSFPSFVIPRLHVEDLMRMFPSALAIAVIGFADTTLVSQGFAARNGYRVNSSRDLAALGTADIVAGTFGGLPVSASSARTAAAEASGAHSQLASIISALAIGVALLIGSDLVSSIPQPALAGIIVAVMMGIVDVDAIATLRRGRASEFAICVVAFLGVAAFGVLQGVAVAVGVSAAMVVLRAARPHDAFLGMRADGALVAMDEDACARPVPGVLVYRIDAPLFFANTDRLRDQILGALTEQAEARPQHVVVAGTAMTDIDYTAMQVLDEIEAQLRIRGIDLTVAGINHRLAAEVQSTQARDSRVRYTTTSPADVVNRRDGSTP